MQYLAAFFTLVICYCFTVSAPDFVTSSRDIEAKRCLDMNAAATAYAMAHQLKPGDQLPPDQLVGSARLVWWESINGHSMNADSGRVYFTKGVVPNAGEPYVEMIDRKDYSHEVGIDFTPPPNVLQAARAVRFSN